MLKRMLAFADKSLLEALVQNKKDHHIKWRPYEQLDHYYNIFAFFRAFSKTSIVAGFNSMAVAPSLITFLRVSG